MSPELLADKFISYLSVKYSSNRHVRRVASWIGFIIMGVHNCKGITNIVPRRTRQIEFEFKNRNFKVKFDHRIGGRGGIEIREFLPGKGAPNGNVVVQVKNLQEAEALYHGLARCLEDFLKKNP